jgi:polar amino acid transport system substrate-binding protein
MVHVWRRLLVALAVGAFGIGAAAVASTEALRVCADPDNLPFSTAAGTERGLYVDVAEMVAARLGVRAEYAWWPTYYGQRAVRNTLLADRCDVFFGLPDDKDFMGRLLDQTSPFLEIGYAIVAPPALTWSSLEDLKRVTIAVQFRSPPQIMLAAREGFRTVTFREVEGAMDALARGEAGAGFLWGPTAGYYNKTRLGGAWRVVPVAGPGLQWQVGAAVRKGDAALKARIESALTSLGPDIRRIADRYGFPQATPVSLDSPAQAATVAQASAPSSNAAGGAPHVNPFDGRADVVPLGRATFNQRCSHCHAPNAQSPEPSRDLRRLKRRYGDQRVEVFYTTVTAGRPTKGMPPWGQALTADEIWQVWTFLESVQAEP